LADPIQEFGYEFTLALVEAIEAETARASSERFAYRGADLRRAVQCALFPKLVNDEELCEAFAAHRRGGEPDPRPGPGIEAAIARRILGQGRGVSAWANERRSLVAGRLSRLRHSGAVQPVAPLGGGATRFDACFLIDHPKFVRFIDPILDRLGRDRVLLAALNELAEDGIDGHGVAHALLPRGDHPAAQPLSDVLAGWGRIPITFDEVVALLAEQRPACAVVIEGNSPYDEVTSQACRALGIPCLCLQHGWSPIVHSGFRRMTFDRMAVWGEGFAEILGSFNPGQRFEVTGNPVLGTATGPAADASAVSFFLQPLSPLIGEEHQRLMHELILRSSDAFAKRRILVREHPGWPLSPERRRRLAERPNIELTPASSHSLAEVIRASRVTVSMYSTSLLESAALGVPPVVFNPTSLPRFAPDLEELGVGIEVKEPAAALEAIGQVLEDSAGPPVQGAMESFQERFFGGSGEAAAERIAQLIRLMQIPASRRDRRAPP
jgi:hypothetical protein